MPWKTGDCTLNVHRHKLNPRWYGAPGANEVRMLLEKLEKLCVEAVPNRPRPVFCEKPHVTWDNYFSGDDALEFSCKRGFGMTCTTRRDRLPKGIPRRFLCKKSTQVNDRSTAYFCTQEASQQRWLFAIDILSIDFIL